MADGFKVDLDALDEAARGVSGVVDAFTKQSVSAIPFRAPDVGNDDLAASISGFLGAWERGVANLVSDVRGVAGKLVTDAAAYATADKSAEGKADAIFQGTGPDPAAQR